MRNAVYTRNRRQPALTVGGFFDDVFGGEEETTATKATDGPVTNDYHDSGNDYHDSETGKGASSGVAQAAAAAAAKAKASAATKPAAPYVPPPQPPPPVVPSDVKPPPQASGDSALVTAAFVAGGIALALAVAYFIPLGAIAA